MRIVECGRSNQDVAILLHGEGLSWWQYRKAARLLSGKFHVVMPVLDGHAGSSRNFNGIESNAREIISYIDRHYGGSVFLISGMSLGGQILLEMMSVRKDICRYAFIESTPVLSVSLKKNLARPAAGLRKIASDTDFIVRADYKMMKFDPSLYKYYTRDLARISSRNYREISAAAAEYEIKDSLYETSAAVHIFAGDREDWLVKGSAVLLRTLIPGSRITLYPDYHFGDLSINHPEEFVNQISSFTGK